MPSPRSFQSFDLSLREDACASASRSSAAQRIFRRPRRAPSGRRRVVGVHHRDPDGHGFGAPDAEAVLGEELAGSHGTRRERPRLELDPGVLPRGVHRPPSLVVVSGGGPFSITARTDLIFTSLESFLRSFSKSPGVTHAVELAQRALAHRPPSPPCALLQQGRRGEGLLEQIAFAADPTKVFAPALAQTYSTCHATKAHRGVLVLAWGMSAARTRASVRVLAGRCAQLVVRLTAEPRVLARFLRQHGHQVVQLVVHRLGVEEARHLPHERHRHLGDGASAASTAGMSANVNWCSCG